MTDGRPAQRDFAAGAAPRNVALCFDGTWNSDDATSPTNVVKTVQALAPATAGRTGQVRYYDRGVGTGRFDRVRGGVFGLGLARNVELAYLWLSGHFRPGDRLFLFGYSRGAYTARSLAGLVGRCGIPDPERCVAGGVSVADVALRAMAIYRLRDDRERVRLARRHVERWAHPLKDPLPPGTADRSVGCEVRFIGVWDTVGALGVPIRWLNGLGARRHRFHDVGLGGHIANAFHAVAIDEGRRPFEPTLWTCRPREGQTVQQLWFPGVHSDVGGGRADTRLADGALLWIWARAHECGLAFQPGSVLAGAAPDPLAPLGDSMSLVYRLWGRHERPMGAFGDDGDRLATGEAVHFSAVRRLDDESTGYRRSAAGRNLARLLEQGLVAAAPPAPGESDPASVVWDAPPAPHGTDMNTWAS